MPQIQNLGETWKTGIPGAYMYISGQNISRYGKIE